MGGSPAKTVVSKGQRAFKAPVINCPLDGVVAASWASIAPNCKCFRICASGYECCNQLSAFFVRYVRRQFKLRQCILWPSMIREEDSQSQMLTALELQDLLSEIRVVA